MPTCANCDMRVLSDISQETSCRRPSGAARKIHQLGQPVTSVQRLQWPNAFLPRISCASRGPCWRARVGEISHKGVRYPGQHAAIVDRDLWERVRRRLQEQGARARGQSSVPSGAPLAGKSFELRPDGLHLVLSLAPLVEGGGPDLVLERDVAMQIRRRSVEMRLVIENSGMAPVKADPVLVKEMARAHRCVEAQMASNVQSLAAGGPHRPQADPPHRVAHRLASLEAPPRLPIIGPDLTRAAIVCRSVNT